jgi:hypothetical protein
MATIKEGGSFETFNDVKGNPLIALNRDGTILTQGIDFADGSIQTTASSGSTGSSGYAVLSVSSNTSLTYQSSTNVLVEMTGGSSGVTAIVPTAIGHAGSTWTFKKVDSSSYNAPAVITFTAGQTADTQSSISLFAQWDEISIISNGSNWRILEAKGGPLNNTTPGVALVQTTVTQDSTYPIGTGVVVNATYANGSPFTDSEPFAGTFTANSFGTGTFLGVQGLRIEAHHKGTGNLTFQEIGVSGQATNDSTGTVAFLAGLQFGVFNTGGGTVTEARGIDINSDNTNAGVLKYTGVTIQGHIYSSAGVNSWGLVITNGARAIAIGGQSGPTISSGAGSPAGVLAAPVGSIYMRTDGSTSTTFYVKETGGTGNTGWVAK